MPERTAANSKRRECVIAYAPLILWAAVILILGSSTGSMAQTSRIIKPLIEFFFPSAAPETFLLVHAAIRKAAHFVEYAVLAMFAARAYGRSRSYRVSGKWMVWALITVLGVACVDEFIQSFNVNRTGSSVDVLLDLAGGIAGLLLVAAYNRFWKGRAAPRYSKPHV